MTIERDTMRATAQDYVRLLMGIQRQEAGRHGAAGLSEVGFALIDLSAWLLDCPPDNTPVTMAEFWRYEAMVNAASVAFSAYVRRMEQRQQTAIGAFNRACDRLIETRTADDEMFAATAQIFLAAQSQLYALIPRKDARNE